MRIDKSLRIFSNLKKHSFTLRLSLAIPLIITLLIFSVGIINIGVFQRFLLEKEAVLIYRSDYAQRFLELLRNQFILSLVASFIVGSSLAYAIVVPLRRLSATAKRAASGDLTQTVGLAQTDELGEATGSFDKMLASLNKYILESMSAGVMTLDVNRKVISLNTAGELILEQESSQLVGKEISQVFPPHSLNKKLYQLFSEAVDQQKTCSSVELDVFTHRGKRLRLGLTTSLLRNQDKRLLGVVMSFRDLAELKDERRLMEIEEKLVSLGRLAAGVAHEVRNPLGSIKGLASLVIEDLGPHDPKRRHLEAILKEIDKLNRVVSHFLELGPQAQRLSLGPVRVNELLDEVLTLAVYDPSSQGIEITKDYSTLPDIQADKEMLKRAFLNIVLNAFLAMTPGGRLSVSTWTEKDKVAVVQFSDTGPGIKDEDVARIFDPFFTTRATGTGLGLSIAHQIVLLHNGHIRVKSKPGQGSSFLVRLPYQRRST
jgi:PAS domain S-box-containing protein